MHTKKMTIPKKTSDDLQHITDAIKSYQQAILEHLKKMANSEALRQQLTRGLLTMTVAGRLVDFTTAYNSNPNADIPNGVYATASVLTGFAKDHLSQLAVTAILGEGVALSATGGVAIVIAGLQILDNHYDGLHQILENQRQWYESLTLPQERQTALEAMQAMQVNDCYGQTLALDGTMTIVHHVLKRLDQVTQRSTRGLSDWSMELFSALRDWSSYFVPNHYGSLSDHSDAIVAACGQPIDNALQLATLTADMMRTTGLPYDVSQGVMAYSFLQGTPFAIGNDWLYQSANLPPQTDTQALLDAIDQRISANPTLQAIKQQLADQKTLAEKLQKIQLEQQKEETLEKLREKGYSDALQLGATVTQFGQLVSSKTLVQAGQVFQQGVQILQGINELQNKGAMKVLEKLGNLNLGPVTMIASGIIGIISLFHASGPSPDEIIIKQLGQIQKGIQQIMENQAVILDAIGQSYSGLLNAIQEGVELLANLMQAEFKEVANEFHTLSNQLNYYTQQILDEIRRGELSIDQGRLAPLRSAIEAAENFEYRYSDSQDLLRREKLLDTMQHLEEWGSEIACDPSFTGNTETNYKEALKNPSIIYRHFPKSDVGLSDVLIQSGFLLEIFKVILLTGVEIQPCNMNLWSQALSAYRKIVPYSMAFPYDLEGRFIQKMLAPASDTKKIVSLFQQNSFLLMSNLQTYLVDKIQKIGTHCESDLMAIQKELTTVYQKKLQEQQEQLSTFIENIAKSPAETPLLTGDAPLALKNIAKSYLSILEARLNNPVMELHQPFAALMSGTSLSIADFGIPARPTSAPLVPAFPDLAIPSALVRAELLDNGQITATFTYLPSEWKEGVLQCIVTLQFNHPDGTQFPIAEINWKGSLDTRGDLNNPRNYDYILAGVALNNLPLYPWSDNCQPSIGNNFPCIKWSHTVTYVIDPLHEKIASVVEKNRLKMLERISALKIVDELNPDEGKNSLLLDLYDLLESRWRLYKAFSVAMGIDEDLVRRMNALDVMHMLIEEITAIQDYDINTGSEVSPLEPRILARFAPFFDGVFNQTLIAGNVSLTNTSVYTSSLADFVNHIERNAQLILAMRQIHTEMKSLDQRHLESASLPAPCQQNALKVNDHPKNGDHHESWFTWTGFFTGMGAMLVLLGSYNYMQRRGRVPPLFYLPLPGAEAKLMTSLGNVPCDALPMPENNTLSLPSDDPFDPPSFAMVLPSSHTHQEEPVFCQGYWDRNIRVHPATGKPIFSYHAICDGIERGTVEFYQHPLLCRSLDGAHHNMMNPTGIFAGDILLDDVQEICDALVPTAVDDFREGVMSGAEHGVWRGTSRLVEQAMMQQGYSERVAQGAKMACYYFAVFAAHTAHHYAADNETPSELGRLHKAAQQAAADTAQLALTSFAVTTACRTVSWAAHQAESHGWHRTAGVMGTVARYAGLSIYAYRSQERGIVHTVGSVAGGYAAETAVELIGNTALSAHRN